MSSEEEKATTTEETKQTDADAKAKEVKKQR